MAILPTLNVRLVYSTHPNRTRTANICHVATHWASLQMYALTCAEIKSTRCFGSLPSSAFGQRHAPKTITRRLTRADRSFEFTNLVGALRTRSRVEQRQFWQGESEKRFSRSTHFFTIDQDDVFACRGLNQGANSPIKAVQSLGGIRNESAIRQAAYQVRATGGRADRQGGGDHCSLDQQDSFDEVERRY